MHNVFAFFERRGSEKADPGHVYAIEVIDPNKDTLPTLRRRFGLPQRFIICRKPFRGKKYLFIPTSDETDEAIFHAHVFSIGNSIFIRNICGRTITHVTQNQRKELAYSSCVRWRVGDRIILSDGYTLMLGEKRC